VELKTPRFSTAIGSNLYAEDRVEYLLLLFFLTQQHKAARRKARLDIQNYVCSGSLHCDHGVVEAVCRRVLLVGFVLCHFFDVVLLLRQKPYNMNQMSVIPSRQ